MSPIHLIVALLPLLAGNELKGPGVEVKAEVSSQIYTWTVRNEGDEPIDSFVLDTFNTYNHHAPEGWEIEVDRGLFRAWTDERHRAIQPRRSAEFSARVSSYGAALGEQMLALGRSGEEPAPVGVIWSPVGRPLHQYILIPVVILGLALFHFALVARRTRARLAPDSSGK